MSQYHNLNNLTADTKSNKIFTEIAPDKVYEHEIFIKDNNLYDVKGFPVKYCEKCNRCWEIDTSFVRRKVIAYYDDFPTLGVERKICDDCKNKKLSASSKIRQTTIVAAILNRLDKNKITGKKLDVAIEEYLEKTFKENNNNFKKTAKSLGVSTGAVKRKFESIRRKKKKNIQV